VDNRDEIKAKSAIWRANNKARAKEVSAASRAKNAEKIKSRSSAYYKKNRDRIRAGNIAYIVTPAGRDACKRRDQNRRAREREAGGNLSKGLAERLFMLQRGTCACGCNQPLGDNYHLDHVMPLALGGSNTDNNIQLLREVCNLQKHAKHPVDFMRQRGFLI